MFSLVAKATAVTDTYLTMNWRTTDDYTGAEYGQEPKLLLDQPLLRSVAGQVWNTPLAEGVLGKTCRVIGRMESPVPEAAWFARAVIPLGS